MTPEQVERVADILTDEADAIRACHARPQDGAWEMGTPCDRRAKADHDEYLTLAAAARKMLARYRKANP